MIDFELISIGGNIISAVLENGRLKRIKMSHATVRIDGVPVLLAGAEGFTPALDILGFLNGKRVDFGVADRYCSILSRFSEFQRKVLLELCNVPYGTTVTYGQLALLAGYPRAARAVGTTMKNTPLPIIIPCHRVCAAGGPGGYSAGSPWKEYLLRIERENSRSD